MENKYLRAEDLSEYSKDELISKVIDLQNDVLYGKEQIAMLKNQLFGRKTEKTKYIFEDNQLALGDFNEAEAIADKAPEEPEKIVVTYSRKKKGKKEEDLSTLDATVINHELSEEQLNEIFGEEEYYRLPDTVYKKVEIIPAKFEVEEHHVAVYKGEKSNKIIRADRPVEMFEKSIATPSLVSYILYNKYANAMPLYRMERDISNYISISRQNMAHWVIKASEMYLSLIYDRMHKELSACPVIQCDETPVNVSKDGRPAGSKSYMWVYRTSERMNRPPIVLYDYEKTRHSDRPYEFLKEFNGYLMCDGFSGYEALGHKKPGLKIVNCLAHARRPFADIEKSLKGYENESGSISKEALSRIRKIYEVEGNLTDCSADERYTRRHQEIEPLIEAYFAWVKDTFNKVAPQSAIGKALAYSIYRENNIKRFLEDGNIPIDNSASERSIRPFTISRKNFVMIDTVSGAKASAIAFSIVETAKANNLNVYQYFKYLLTEIPKHMNETNLRFIDDLLPWSDSIPDLCKKKS